MDEHIKELATKKFISNYLDSMPTKSRITMRELAGHAAIQMEFDPKKTYEFVREILSSRKDFLILRGIGACKL